MTQEEEQAFLKALDDRLWTAADKLRTTLDAAQYKHAVLGLIFLKYVSDTFLTHQEALKSRFNDEADEYYLDPEDYGGSMDSEEFLEEVQRELEERDYYSEANVFWVPPLARWKNLCDNAKIPAQTEIKIPGREAPYKMGTTG